MTFYHFGNCFALAYVPYHLTYKYSGLAEYGAFWKCITAGFVYLFTQLAKMIFVATFFPTFTEEEQATDHELPFDFVTEFLNVTVDLVDLIGLYMVMQRVSGKGQVKILVAGMGWSFADFLLTRLIFLWVGAKGIAFDWKYIQASLESNLSLLHYLSLACLVWLWSRRKQHSLQLSQYGVQLSTVVVALLFVGCYKSLLLDFITYLLRLSPWAALFYKAIFSSSLAFICLQTYVGFTSIADKY